MRQPVVHEDAAGQGEHLRLVLQPAEGGRENKPVIVAFELRTVVVSLGVPMLLSEPFVAYQLLPIHHNECKSNAFCDKNQYFFKENMAN